MKNQSRRYISVKKRNKRRALRRRVLIMMLMALAMVFLFSGFSTQASTEEGQAQEMIYQAIIVEPGDSLWSIAEFYAEHAGLSVEEYIARLKKMNDLHGDRIIAGKKLLVCYYPE